MSSLTRNASIMVNIGAQATGFTTGVKSVESGLRSLAKTSSSVSRSMNSFSYSMTSGLTTAGKTTASLGKSFSSLGATIGATSAIVSTFISLIGTELTQAVSYGIERLDALSIYPKVMQNLGYSADDANDSISKIMDELDGLPVAADTITNTTKQIAAFTDSLDEATDYALAFSDAFLASGTTSTTDLRRGMTQMQQMMANGEPDYFGWRTLSETMSVALQQVATELLGTDEANKKTKKSAWDLYAAIDAGTVTWDEFIETLDRANKDGVAGFASLKEQALDASATIATALQNIGIRAGAAVANFLGAAFGQLDDGETDEYTSDWERADARIADIINNWSKSIKALGTPLGEWVNANLDALNALLAGLVGGFVIWKAAITPVLSGTLSLFSRFAGGSADLLAGIDLSGVNTRPFESIADIMERVYRHADRAAGKVAVLRSILKQSATAAGAAEVAYSYLPKTLQGIAASATAAGSGGLSRLQQKMLGLSNSLRSTEVQLARVDGELVPMSTSANGAAPSLSRLQKAALGLRTGLIAVTGAAARPVATFRSLTAACEAAAARSRAFKVAAAPLKGALMGVHAAGRVASTSLSALGIAVGAVSAKMKAMALSGCTAAVSGLKTLGTAALQSGKQLGTMALAGVQKGLAGIAGGLASIAKLGVAAVIVSLVATFAKLYNASEKLQNTVKKLGNAFTGGFCKGLEDSGGAMGKLSKALGGGSESAGDSLAAKLEGMVKPLRKIGKSISSAIGPIANTIAKFVTGFAEGFGDNIDTQLITNTLTVISNSFESIKEIVFGEGDGKGSKKKGENAGSTVADTINSIVETIKGAAAKLPAIIAKIKAVLGKITTFFSNFGKGFAEGFDEDQFERLKTSLGNLGESLGNLFTSIFGGDGSGSGSGKKGGKTTGESTGETVAEVINVIVKALQSLADVLAVVVDVVDWLWNNIIEPYVIPALSTIVDWVKTLLAKLRKFSNWVEDNLPAAAQFFTDLKDTVVNAFKRIKNAVQNAISTLKDFLGLSGESTSVTVQGETYTVTGTGSTGTYTSAGSSMKDSTGTISGMSALSTSSTSTSSSLSTMSTAIEDTTSSLSTLSALSSSLSSLSTTSSLSATRTRRALSSSGWERVGTSSKLALADIVSSRESERSTTTNNVSAPVTVQGASPEQVAAAVVRRINLAL